MVCLTFKPDIAQLEQNPHWPLCAYVLAIIGYVDTLGDVDLSRGAMRVQARILEPLRVAVAGNVSVGKSTLVNALLGVPVAPTGGVETTRVLTEFRGGRFERVEVLLRDGTSRPSSLDESGRLPGSFGVPASEISRVQVQLTQSHLLSRIVLIDTPGTASASSDASTRTSEALFIRDSLDAVSDADALLFVLKGVRDDVEAIEAFSALTTGARSTMINTLGLINVRVEELGDAESALRAAERVAARLHAVPALRKRLIDVVPVLGLLAQAGSTYLLEDDDLVALSTIMRSEGFEEDVENAQAFVERDDGFTRERARLMTLLAPRGVRLVADLLSRGVTTPDGVADALREASNLGRVIGAIETGFIPYADAIKADQALARLRHLAESRSTRAASELRAVVEGALLNPWMHGLRELDAMSMQAAGDVVLPPQLEEEMHRLFAPGTVAQKLGLPGADVATQREAAKTAIERLSRLANGPRTKARLRQLLEVMITSYVICLSKLSEGTSGVAADE